MYKSLLYKFYYGYHCICLTRETRRNFYKSRLQLTLVSALHAGHYQLCIKILNKIQLLP